MAEKKFKFVDRSSGGEQDARQELLDLFKNTPIPDGEIQTNLGLFLSRQTMARFLWMHEIYQKAMSAPGVVMEFGVRWGQNLALFSLFRAIYEPYNYTRKVIGFDTFSGFAGTAAQDGNAEIIQEGAYSVTPGYEDYLDRILRYHQKESPVAHIRKHELVKGDAAVTLERYLKEHPETIVSLAYFNMDIYQPTYQCLQALKPHLTKGSIIGFDELNCPHFPGETTALRDAIGLDRYRLVRQPHNPYPAYIVIE